MHWPSASKQLDFETLYRTYWTPVVRFCATCLIACPDGTAEEVAQDVFLAAHHALAEQRYRGEGSFLSWLFGIAHNLCCKRYRKIERQTTPPALRRLERDLARLEQHAAALIGAKALLAPERQPPLQEQLTLARHGLEHAREHFQQRLREAAHCEPPISPEAQGDAEAELTILYDSLKRLARCDRQAYALLHMHVCKGITVRELAVLQGMSRSAVARSLARAKTMLRTVYQAALAAQHSSPLTLAHGSTHASTTGVEKRRPITLPVPAGTGGRRARRRQCQPPRRTAVQD